VLIFNDFYKVAQPLGSDVLSQALEVTCETNLINGDKERVKIGLISEATLVERCFGWKQDDRSEIAKCRKESSMDLAFSLPVCLTFGKRRIEILLRKASNSTF
jgi:hypothetical protein